MLHGYNRASDEFLIQDPALAVGSMPVHSAIFDAARQTFGTDEDLLLISLPSRMQAWTGQAGPSLATARQAQVATVPWNDIVGRPSRQLTSCKLCEAKVSSIREDGVV